MQEDLDIFVKTKAS